MVNHHWKLNEHFEKYKEQYTIDRALELVYENYILGTKDKEILSLWEKLEPETEKFKSVPIINNVPLQSDIRELINKYGWRTVMEGFVDFAARQMKLMNMCGMSEYASQWESVRDKFGKMNKTVQL